MTDESVIEIPLFRIKANGRHRKDYGDIASLAASIEQLGLLQPIGITANHELVFGQRRLLAFQHLGRTSIPARVIDVPALVLAEHAENEIRKDFTASERVEIGKAIEAELGNRQGQRTDLANAGQGSLLADELRKNFCEVTKRTDQVAAEKAGFGNETTYRQAKAVTEHATPELVEAMDLGKVAISTAAKLATAPVEVQRQAVADPKKAIELAKTASTAKVKEIRQTAKAERQAITTAHREDRLKKIAEISQGNVELDITVHYPVLYADPPWRYEHSESESRAIENQYPTMTLDEICALPVDDLATPDAILFLWATSPKLAESMQVIESWGFTYRTCAVWDKQKIGMGYYFRQQHELLLVATRGSIPTPTPEHRPASVFSEARGDHSAKPVQFAAWIEAMYPTLPRIELFCRSPRDGWATWGNQS
jgi:N6-adenosine-specific RNA methylase IME4/ParB-like chromosome segregation protein Spo0J